MNFRTLDLLRLNSATKYPSIPTFHTIGEKGRLQEEHLPLPDAPLYASEKIDGTNARILVPTAPDLDTPRWIIGSREELLCADGDLIGDPSLGIVSAVREIASRAADALFGHRLALFVLYGEVYGGRVSAASRAYTKTGSVGFRLFDMVAFTAAQLEEALGKDRADISSWREHGGQTFLDVDSLTAVAGRLDLKQPPRLAIPRPIPSSVVDAAVWLSEVVPLLTHAGLDGEPGRAEGCVVRTADRKFIAKLRFEDYERTLGMGRRR